MRISNISINTLAVNAIDSQETAYSQTQQQISSGKRVNTPADDPVAAVQIAQLTNTESQNTQYTSNGQAASTSLGLEQTALSDSTTTLQSIRDLVVQANSGTNNASDLKAIATQIQSLESQLQGVGNRTDSNGNYLFSGYASKTQPFVRDSSGSMVYNGSSGAASVQLDGGNSVATGDAGSSVFMGVTTGNGTFTTAASSSNTGSGVIDTGSVTNKSAWVSGTYTINFTDATDYTVTDSAGTVTTGTYDPTNGGSVSFDGIQVGITGAPASGDSFTVAASGSEDVFTSIDKIVSALNTAAATNTTASKAQLSSTLGGSLQQIDQALNQVSTVTTNVGTRLNLVTSVSTSLANQNLTLATQVSNLGDLDYAAATSKLSSEYVELQAAEASYAQIAQLSLFKYLS